MSKEELVSERGKASYRLITLAPQDTLIGVLARVRAATDSRILLVVPPTLSFSLAELHILRREAAGKGLELALLTSNARLRQLAAEVGISTFRDRRRAERAHWRRLRLATTLSRPSIGPATVMVPHGAGLFGKSSPSGFRPTSFVRAFVPRPRPWLSVLGLMVALVVLSAGLVAVLAIVIPEATITLVPAAETIQTTVRLRAVQDAALDPEAGTVPARALSVQVSGEARMPTTGRRLEPNARATGQVVLVNRTAAPLSIPAGTIVSTATGNNVRFVTTAEALLVPNGRTTVPIEALLPGPSGNVRAGTITKVEGPLALSLLVANEVPTSGGTLAPVGVVTEEDQERLQAHLFDSLKQQAFEQLTQRLEPGAFIPPESVNYLALSPTFTPFVGEAASELYLRMTVQAVGLVVDAPAANRIAFSHLQEIMPPGTRLISDTLRYIPGAIVVENERTVAFSLMAEGILLRGVDATTVRNLVLGMSPEEAAALLVERFPLAAWPEIHLGPDWLPYVVPTHISTLPWRIRVVVDWDTAAALVTRG